MSNETKYFESLFDKCLTWGLHLEKKTNKNGQFYTTPFLTSVKVLTLWYSNLEAD